MKVTIYEGLKIIEENIKKRGYEIVSLHEATNRVCAQDLYAKFDLPRFDNSAMDGFAIKLSSLGKKVKVVDTIFAGDNKEIEIKDNEAIKIMTGAKIPKNCEAVIPFEDVILEEDFIILPNNIKKYANIRRAGEDVKKGEIIIKDKELINSFKISLLASQGYSYIKVYKKVRVGVFATGAELKMHYENLLPYQIYNSNTPLYYSRAKELGCEVSFLGSSKDDIESIKELIQNSQDFDLLITSGGVSVGEADFTKKAFLDLGAKILFDKVEIKPGKPTTFGILNSSIVLNLPGNPLAASINFEIFGRFIINILSNKKDIYQNYIEAVLKDDIKNRPGREVVIPGFFDGNYFIPSKKRGPGMVSVMANSNGYIILSKDISLLKKESIVKFIPITFDFYSNKKVDFITK